MSFPQFFVFVPCGERMRCRGLVVVLLGALLLGARVPQVYAASDTSFVRTIYLVRHGSYAPDPKINSEVGPPLTALGIVQSRLAGARLRAMPVVFDSISSSTMTRARETAAAIREQLPKAAAGSSALLSECTPPAFIELRGETEAMQAACRQRLDQAFAKYATPAVGADKHDVLVCHGNVIRYFVTKALGVDPRAWMGMSVQHASITLIQVGPNGAFRVMAVGDAGHVPPSLQSWGTDMDPQLAHPDLGPFR
jgi:serine/threonine-protein phosphatase PGAM5